jgi:hypothetical protein
MAAAIETQVGVVTLNGIRGTITITGAATFNMSSRTVTENFKVDRIPSQNGAYIETMIASQRNRTVELEFAPTGATRAAAVAVVGTLMALNPLETITIGQSGSNPYEPSIAALTGSTWNLMEGMQLRESREGILSVTMKLEAQEVGATGDTFAALATVAT